ncbi:MAG: RpiR family transcriptional regulator, carbohydrate utilization regulator [Thermotogaceae bacterium]|jgi:DNA-binding MurR/RpiR family transcriptional regulator|nr:RpiR family transcriptional regulator, carbohydrate utilization regulator [Thermotogaceae bacterium]MDN5337057.1 RpiR family transcriptional regulator, carbohydrate utilization regulator [Thermotogaceae bacterium]
MKKGGTRLILAKLKGIYNSLSDSEKLAANYILERPDDVIHYSITEFARHCGASEATIYRLCRKLGFSGYQNFKIVLARELSFPKDDIIESRNRKNLREFIEGIFAENFELLKDTHELLDFVALSKAVEIILSSNRILFFGVGRSGALAQDASLRFALLGFHSAYYIDPHAQVMVGASLSNKDVVIGISHSGMIRDIVKSLQVAQDSGAKTIAITSGIDSPITKVSDVSLYCAAGKRHPSDFHVSRVGELIVIDTLYKAVLFKMKDRVEQHFENLDEVLKPKRF